VGWAITLVLLFIKNSPKPYGSHCVCTGFMQCGILCMHCKMNMGSQFLYLQQYVFNFSSYIVYIYLKRVWYGELKHIILTVHEMQ
jgi:hypothetical protein